MVNISSTISIVVVLGIVIALYLVFRKFDFGKIFDSFGDAGNNLSGSISDFFNNLGSDDGSDFYTPDSIKLDEKPDGFLDDLPDSPNPDYQKDLIDLDSSSDTYEQDKLDVVKDAGITGATKVDVTESGGIHIQSFPNAHDDIDTKPKLDTDTKPKYDYKTATRAETLAYVKDRHKQRQKNEQLKKDTDTRPLSSYLKSGGSVFLQKDETASQRSNRIFTETGLTRDELISGKTKKTTFNFGSNTGSGSKKPTKNTGGERGISKKGDRRKRMEDEAERARQHFKSDSIRNF